MSEGKIEGFSTSGLVDGHRLDPERRRDPNRLRRPVTPLLLVTLEDPARPVLSHQVNQPSPTSVFLDRLVVRRNQIDHLRPLFFIDQGEKEQRRDFVTVRLLFDPVPLLELIANHGLEERMALPEVVQDGPATGRPERYVEFVCHVDHCLHHVASVLLQRETSLI